MLKFKRHLLVSKSRENTKRETATTESENMSSIINSPFSNRKELDQEISIKATKFRLAN